MIQIMDRKLQTELGCDAANIFRDIMLKGKM